MVAPVPLLPRGSAVKYVVAPLDVVTVKLRPAWTVMLPPSPEVEPLAPPVAEMARQPVQELPDPPMVMSLEEPEALTVTVPPLPPAPLLPERALALIASPPLPTVSVVAWAVKLPPSFAPVPAAFTFMD